MAQLPGYDCFATAADGEWFDEQDADNAVAFFHECLTHVEGALSGKPFKLEEWQQAIVGAIFGWKRKDETRRYREVLIFIPRKNGKSPLAAGIACLVLFCDLEAGQQNVLAAGDRDQAALLFRQMCGMIANEPELSDRCTIFGARGGSVTRAITKPDNSVCKVVSADADTKHGGNLHLAIIDELHVQPNRDLVDVIQTSMASLNRRQPLLIHVTTSDFDRESICNEKRDYAIKVRDRVFADSAFLPVIYEAQPTEDWRDEKVWAKANPNLGVSVSIDYLRRECQRAIETPSYENTFRRLHLNVKTEQDVRWLSLEKWDACGTEFNPENLVGRECFAGLDLSTRTDVTACVYVFPPVGDEQSYRVLPRFWIPRANAEARERRDRVPYLTWIKRGFVNATEGDVVDYEFIKSAIIADGKKFKIREIAYDPWNATQIALQLQAEGAAVIEFGQGFRSMSEPSKELEKLVISGKWDHGNNPVMRWMASNVSIEQDPAGNIKPSKRRSTERIDGIVAGVMALGRSMVTGAERGSVYRSRGLMTV